MLTYLQALLLVKGTEPQVFLSLDGGGGGGAAPRVLLN